MSESFFLEFFAAMFAIANPFTNLPIFLSLTTGELAKKRKRIAAVSILAAAIICTIIVFAGTAFLQIFGIGIPSFEIAGGIIIFFIALSMLHAKQNTIHHSASNTSKATAESNNPSIVPLAIPLIGGPGTLSTIMVYTNRVPDNLVDYSSILIVIYGALFLVWLAFYFGDPLAKFLGTNGMSVISRIMGIILAAISIDMVMHGIKTGFAIS